MAACCRAKQRLLICVPTMLCVLLLCTVLRDRCYCLIVLVSVLTAVAIKTFSPAQMSWVVSDSN